MDDAPKTQKRRRHGHISVACRACKNRRSKCSGGPPPCTLCAKLETECHFDPDADMRRRSSRDNTKTYKALLSAFVDSLRRNDVPLALSLHQVIRTADQSGRLSEVAEEYAESIRPGWLASAQEAQADDTENYHEAGITSSPNPELPALEDLDDNFSLSAGSPSTETAPSVQDSAEASVVAAHGQAGRKQSRGRSDLPPAKVSPQHSARHASKGKEADLQADLESLKDDTASLDSIGSKDELRAFLKEQLDLRQLTINDLPLFVRDPFIIETDDLMSRTIISFRDSARQAIGNGVPVERILESPKPDLSLLFRERTETDSHTAWTWACDFGKAFDNCSFVLRLATVYLVGIQMRFFIWPRAETFNDLPLMLRPLQKQYSVAHPAGIDLCHIPALKNFYFDHWDQYEGLLTAGQSCNWPYSDSACLAYDRSRQQITLSRAFLEHLRDLNNYSIGKGMLDQAPSLKGQVRINNDPRLGTLKSP